MASKPADNKVTTRVPSTMTTTSGSNQLYVAENLELPEDTFRMSLDNFSVIGENVTIAERDTSVDSSNVGTPVLVIPTLTPTPETETLTPPDTFPIITETPKAIITEQSAENARKRPQPFLKLSLTKKNDDIFVKPSPVMELMSPAKMLQFEVNYPASATPTMKRAAIDFDFFAKNKFNDFFGDEYYNNKIENKNDDDKEIVDADKIEEAQVIVKPNTVRHEIEYGKYGR